MFRNYDTSGKHLICDLKEIKNQELLNSMDGLKELMIEICKKNEFQILDTIEYKFEPIGCTILFLLSESHMSIHTFPEKNHISFDLYTCRQYKDNEQYNMIIRMLISRLQASNNSVCKVVDRRF
jgi:S-adenosylmethionine decarboxylase proenzyme